MYADQVGRANAAQRPGLEVGNPGHVKAATAPEIQNETVRKRIAKVVHGDSAAVPLEPVCQMMVLAAAAVVDALEDRENGQVSAYIA